MARLSWQAYSHVRALRLPSEGWIYTKVWGQVFFDGYRIRTDTQQPRTPMHYVYLLRSESSPEKRYVGSSDDLKRRVAEHNSGRNVSTAAYRPWRLQTYLGFSAKAPALAFERYLKTGSGHAFARKRLW